MAGSAGVKWVLHGEPDPHQQAAAHAQKTIRQVDRLRLTRRWG